jgi:carboxypeptidase Q
MRLLSSRLILFVCAWNLLTLGSSAQTAPEPVDQAMIAKIKQEGLERSQVMETISYLTDVHGPRLTGSPLTKIAADWTLERMQQWGLQNSHLETWGPFGRGWTLEGCMVNLVEPNYAPLIAHVKAWSPSTTRTIRGVPIYFDAETPEELEKFRGKLGRAIVLISPPRELPALFEAPATRKSEEELLRLANAAPPQPRSGRTSRRRTPAPVASPSEKEEVKEAAANAQAENQQPTDRDRQESAKDESDSTQPAPKVDVAAKEPAATKPAEPSPTKEATPPATPKLDPRALAQLQSDKWQMAYAEGAAVILEPGRGDGGNVFVASVTIPRSSEEGAEGNRFSRGVRPWATEATNIIPQAVLAAEHYNRLVRMLELGVQPELEIDILARYHENELDSFNIIAEIPGTDLKDEVVMLGAHFDSWQAGTGATDNAVGCGVALEAIRILQAIDAKPRRTIRVALWTGEEQGLLGSRAYVAEHFGKIAESNPDDSEAEDNSGDRRSTRPTYEMTPEQEKLSAYYNLDNGTGKIRGIYLQGNESVRSIFRSWLAPFDDMDASTISAANTGGTDHLAFDAIGIPGFQFIQDAIEYSTRTHHSSMDVYERIQEDDVKQASMIMASFVYHTAMRDDMLPRKPLNGDIKIIPRQLPTQASQPESVSVLSSPE